MKNLILVFVSLAGSLSSLYGQASLEGESVVCPGVAAYTYYMSSFCDSPPNSSNPGSITFSWTVVGGTIESSAFATGSTRTTASGVGLVTLAYVRWNQSAASRSVSVSYTASTGACMAGTRTASKSITIQIPSVAPETPTLEIGSVKMCPGNGIGLTARLSSDPNSDSDPSNNVWYFWEYSINSGPFIAIRNTPENNTTYTLPNPPTTTSQIKFRVYTKYSRCGNFDYINQSGYATTSDNPLLAVPPTPVFGVCIEGTTGTIYLKSVSGSSLSTNYYLNVENFTSARGIKVGDIIPRVVSGVVQSPSYMDPYAAAAYQFYYDIGTNPADGCAVTGTTPAGNDHTLTATAAANCTGGLTLTSLSGGPGPYTFKANNGSYQSASTFSNLTPGNYTITVRDKYGCIGTTSAVETFSALAFNASTVSPDCPGSAINNGRITLNVSGGKAPLNYSMDGSTYQSSPTFSSLSENSGYNMYVKDSNGSGCILNTTVPVANSNSITITSASGANPTCNGSSDGSITVTASGGMTSLSYSVNGTDFQPETLLDGLLSGTYTVTVKDANACTTTFGPVTLDNPSLITFPTAASTAQSCAEIRDGAINVRATGGTGTISYSLNVSPYTTYANANPVNGSMSYTQLLSGSYTVTAKDANNCTNSRSIIVSLQPTIGADFTELIPISCNGQRDGALKVTGKLGNGGYSYKWNGGPTSDTYSGIGDGTYSVEITDVKGCKQTFSRSIAQPAPLALTYVKANYNGFGVSCSGMNNGNINVTVSGGTPKSTAPFYNYVWTNGINGANVEDQPNLPAGDYSVAVTDEHGCSVQSGNISLIAPAPLTLISPAQRNISCMGGNNGMVSLTAGGGTGSGTYSYSKDNLKWRSVSVFDTLTARAYTMRVRDINGCSKTLPIVLTEPLELVLSISGQTETSCGESNASATVLANGGTVGQDGYHYSWYNNTTPNTTAISTTATIQNMAAGSYKARVIDDKGCIDEVDVFLSNSNGPLISVDNIVQTTCNESADGSIAISVTQGTSPYAVKWPGGEETLNVSNLTGKDYTVSVRDVVGCLAFKTIRVPSPPAITFTTQLRSPLCNGYSDGEIAVAAQGGNGGLSYQWSDGATGNVRTLLRAGDYFFKVTDIKNCTVDHQIVLPEPPPVVVDLGEDRTICVGQRVTVSPGLEGTYAWTSNKGFSSTSSSVVLSEGGIYKLAYRTLQGCLGEDEFEIETSTDLLKADFLMVAESVVGDTIVVIDVSWPEPESISWEFPAGGSTVNLDGPFAEISFAESGLYEIVLHTRLGECIDSYTKKINILKNRVDAGGRIANNEPLITSAEIYPNPTSGIFLLDIYLRELADVSVSVVSIEGGRTYLTAQNIGQDFYSLNFNVGELPAGVYYVMIKAKGKVKVLRLLKI